MTISATALLLLITIFITVLSILGNFEGLIMHLVGKVCVYAYDVRVIISVPGIYWHIPIWL